MEKIKKIVFLHSIIFLYALSSICAKYAAGLEFFSVKWFLIYGLQIFILGCYALLWQQILKIMPLNFAFANKSVTLVWGMIFGIALFDEKLTVWNIVGALIVLVGVIFMVTEDGKATEQGVAESSSEARQDG